jgi:hypothetical protein
MGKYLIIDLSLVEKGQMSEVRLEQLINDVESGDGIILTEDETLAKFKKVWDSAIESASCNINYERMIDKYDTENDWQEFKKQL